MFAFQEQQDKLNKFLIHQLVLKAAYTLTVEFCGNKVSNFYQVCNFDNAGFGLILEMAMYGICAIGGLAIYRTVIIREKPDHQYSCHVDFWFATHYNNAVHRIVWKAKQATTNYNDNIKVQDDDDDGVGDGVGCDDGGDDDDGDGVRDGDDDGGVDGDADGGEDGDGGDGW
ncbi:hypothetical protein BSL78_08498 [Apostichopus japonicus]|uniref:Uncharacterized protein n=1 Tax=Stichopus japonicus TaxID=307972 RepID=A0A2G8L2X1_STIJA|nr:hypothetical protein BSL78_08498 [Apostichopus japonicus]